ncbi:MAG TPA: IS21 family transposase [Bryobacteraceae bacterium]|nr:IS21 family transposase [Bryobacteraceae bacterium]
MRKTREILRLSALGLAQHQIARSCSIVQSTVHKYLKLARAANLGWPLPGNLSDEQLDQLLFGQRSAPPSRRQHPEPDFAAVHHELESHRDLTLELVWQEYRQAHPAGYGYSRFCDLYRQWYRARKITMRQQHKPGEKMFVDYAGATIPVHNRNTGEVHEAAVFVAVLGFSSYTFAEATWSQELSCWIGSHIRAFEYFGGLPMLVIPDNARTGVNKACRYEPDLNPTYSDMAAHYSVGVIPARPRRPRDKAKVENAVQVVQRWVVAALRKRTFFSLAEVNEAIAELLVAVNNKPFHKREGTRASVFAAVDKPALRPLPAERYEIGRWRSLKVDLDYHVPAEGHFYSVPYQLVGRQVDIRVSGATVEIFHKGLRVASHARSFAAGEASTVAEHRPKAHQQYLAWTPSRLLDWADAAGPHTGRLFREILAAKPHPEMGYRCCLGLVRLGGRYGLQRLEAAAARALYFGSYSLASVESMLRHRLENQPMAEPSDAPLAAVIHGNIRGAAYFDSTLQ